MSRGVAVVVGAAATRSVNGPAGPAMTTRSASIPVSWPRPFTIWPKRTSSLRPTGNSMTAKATLPTTVPASRYPLAVAGSAAVGVSGGRTVGGAVGVAVAGGGGGGT